MLSPQPQLQLGNTTPGVVLRNGQLLPAQQHRQRILMAQGLVLGRRLALAAQLHGPAVHRIGAGAPALPGRGVALGALLRWPATPPPPPRTHWPPRTRRRRAR